MAGQSKCHIAGLFSHQLQRLRQLSPDTLRAHDRSPVGQVLDIRGGRAVHALAKRAVEEAEVIQRVNRKLAHPPPREGDSAQGGRLPKKAVESEQPASTKNAYRGASVGWRFSQTHCHAHLDDHERVTLATL